MFFSAELQQNTDLMVTEYNMFAANPMGASFDQSSTGAGTSAVGGWSANLPRAPTVVSTLRRSQAAINSPRSVIYHSLVASITVSPCVCDLASVFVIN